jgi:hypothetical protein
MKNGIDRILSLAIEFFNNNKPCKIILKSGGIIDAKFIAGNEMNLSEWEQACLSCVTATGEIKKIK